MFREVIPYANDPEPVDILHIVGRGWVFILPKSSFTAGINDDSFFCSDEINSNVSRSPMIGGFVEENELAQNGTVFVDAKDLSCLSAESWEAVVML